jgi:hypothetical protein
MISSIIDRVEYCGMTGDEFKSMLKRDGALEALQSMKYDVVAVIRVSGNEDYFVLLDLLVELISRF